MCDIEIRNILPPCIVILFSIPMKNAEKKTKPFSSRIHFYIRQNVHHSEF